MKQVKRILPLLIFNIVNYQISKNSLKTLKHLNSFCLKQTRLIKFYSTVQKLTLNNQPYHYYNNFHTVYTMHKSTTEPYKNGSVVDLCFGNGIYLLSCCFFGIAVLPFLRNTNSIFNKIIRFSTAGHCIYSC